jgi:hypothetical protein
MSVAVRLTGFAVGLAAVSPPAMATTAERRMLP